MAEKYDLHVHGYTNWRKGKLSLEPWLRTPEYILNKIKRAGLNGVVLTNFGHTGEWKYAFEEFTESARYRENLGDYNLVKKLENALIFADNGGLLKVIKGEEFSVEGGGHFMTIGLEANKIIPSGLRLKNALEQIKNFGTIANADHALGFLGIGMKNLEVYKDLIDVWEAKNMNYEHRLLKPVLGINPSVDESNKISEQLEIPWIAVSDCHNTNQFGYGNVEIQEGLLDFSTSDNLKDSLKEVLKNRKFKPIPKKPIPLASVIGHIIICHYDIYIRNKLGWVNLENK